MAERWKIVLCDGLDEAAEARLAARADVTRVPAHDADALRSAVADADALVVRTYVRVTAALLDAAPRLRVVGVAGVGLDRVDVAAAEARQVAVLNRPGAATHSVAELAVGLMLNLLRPMAALSAAYGRGEFRPARAQPHGVELRSLTVGILGMGRIGSAVGRICAAGIGARVIYNDIAPVGPFDFAAEGVNKATLWRESDVLSVHVPLTPETRGLIGTDVLGQMRPGAMLINTARGAVVDTDALVASLRNANIGAVGLDVVEPEPLPTDHALWKCANCLLTPHIASRTVGGMARMNAVGDDVLAYLVESGAGR